MRTPVSRRVGVGIAVAALGLLAAACGGGDDDTTRTVKATDYAFKDLPKSVKAGTVLSLENTSATELHELVAFKVPDTEKRPVSELLQLPEAELDAIFPGAPATVLLRPPGGEQINAVGDGTLTEKGRYAVICTIPTGADPAAYLAASQTSDGPPDVAGGPPHFTKGMFGELTVK